MSLWATVVHRAFRENKGILSGNPNIILNDGSPDTAVTAAFGTLCYDYTNDDVYINEDGSTNWIQINA